MTRDQVRVHLYDIYKTIKRRCNEKDYKDYRLYGARGIKMCREWEDDFDTFYEWALIHGYEIGLTIDRRCNNRGYSPGNCTWVSRKTQANNRRTNTVLEHNGSKHTIAEWGSITGIDPDLISDRLVRGWSVKKALDTPVRKYHWHIED